MIRNLLITISADPRKSPRPGEAVRIAAGVGAWNKVKVHLYLKGAALHCADELADDFLNGHLFLQYLPSVTQHGGKLVTDAANPLLKKVQTQLPIDRLDADQLAEFRSSMDHVMTFA